MTISVQMAADSVSPAGKRISSMVLKYPRFIHAELMTHRVFSRNASSSRAIPVKKVLANIKQDMAEPIHWGSNQPGMQAHDQLSGIRLWLAKVGWKVAGRIAIILAKLFMFIGLHKQVANRITEPFSHITVLVTATEWSNWFALRNHKMAQPEIRKLAELMAKIMEESTPISIGYNNWHLPFVSKYEQHQIGMANAIKCCVARCARLSYLNHDKSNPTVEGDIELYNMLGVRPYSNDRKKIYLTKDEPVHLSPYEHACKPMPQLPIELGNTNIWPAGVTHMDRNGKLWSGNVCGWIQHRQLA